MDPLNTTEQIKIYRYVTGTWSHIFGTGTSNERGCRIVYDRQAEKLVSLEIEDGVKGWVPASESERADVEESLKRANEEALQTPETWGLSVSDSRPEWAQESAKLLAGGANESPKAKAAYTPLKVSIDGVEETFEAFTNGRTWNGWACPEFTFEEAMKVAAATNVDSGGSVMIYVPGEDRFKYLPNGLESSADEVEEWAATEIKVNDQTVMTYAIGAFSWTWAADSWENKPTERKVVKEPWSYVIDDHHGAVLVTRSDGATLLFQGDDAEDIRRRIERVQVADPDCASLFNQHSDVGAFKPVEAGELADSQQIRLDFHWADGADTSFIGIYETTLEGYESGDLPEHGDFLQFAFADDNEAGKSLEYIIQSAVDAANAVQPITRAEAIAAALADLSSRVCSVSARVAEGFRGEALKLERSPALSRSAAVGSVAISTHSLNLGTEGDQLTQLAQLLVSLQDLCTESGMKFEEALSDAQTIQAERKSCGLAFSM